MSINVNDKNLGHATAYAYYKAGGGTMTEAEFTEFMADFGTASQTAVEAAQAALASETAARNASTTATNKATEATTAAQTATTKAAEAQADADAAALDASQALSAASTATTKATEATTAAATATSAKTDAVAANTAAQSAKTAAQTAQTGAETAAASVQSSAAQIATNTSDITELKEDLTATDTRISNNMLRYEQDYQEDFEVANEYATKYLVRALGGTSYNITNHASNAVTVRQKLLDGTASNLGNVASLGTSTFTFDNECDIGIYSATDINVTIKNVNGVLHRVKVIGDEVDALETHVDKLNIMSQRGDLVAYITNYGEFWNNDRDVHFGGNLIVRPDGSGTAYTFTVAQIISKASSAGLTTLSDGYNSGAVSFLYFDLDTKDIGFATSWLSDKTKVVLFGYSYKLTFGLLVDYYVAKNSYLIEPLSDKVDTIISSGTTSIPSYWKTYIDGKINDIRSLVESSDDSFFFVTDIHVPRNQKHSPNIIRYIQSLIDIPNVICGGDYLTSADSKRGALVQLYAWINASDRDWMQVRGNHDTNYLGTGAVTSKDFFNVSTRRLRNGVTVKEYPDNIFVYDNENTKFRYIFLDTVEEGTYDISDQVAWMQTKITELDSTWSVIVFTHMYFAPRGVTTETLTALDVGRQIKEGIDNIYDNANATIVAYICGHCHRDYSLITEKGYPIISTSCDASTGDTVSGWDRNYPTATVGTITEQCMDIFGIDKTNRLITAYRIGRGSVADSASEQGATIQRTFAY